MTIKILYLLLLLFIFSSCNDQKNTKIDIDTTVCRDNYPEQATSNYILPYATDSVFIVGQANCTDGSHTINTDQAYAYDFDMPVDTNVIASRAGTVIVVTEKFQKNNQTAGQANYLIIEHDDNTISGYYHLTQDGVVVEVGDVVAQGDNIAYSGNTGDSSEAHLHFEVALCEDCQTLPINFKNTRQHKNGLIEGEAYKAE